MGFIARLPHYLSLYNCMHKELYHAQRHYRDPGRGEEIVYMGGPQAYCKDYRKSFMALLFKDNKNPNNM